MKYDFETVINRKNTGSDKWNSFFEILPDACDDVTPFSLADMEFANPPEIKEGLKKYIDDAVFGYTSATDAYYDSIISWMRRRHGFSPKKEWFVMSAGIVPVIKEMVGLFTKPEDTVLLLTPVYYPFKMCAEWNGRKVVNSELILKDGEYSIDFEDFEKKAKDPSVSLFILCNPHNPIGRVWKKEELLKLADICLKNNVFVISDEIHSDLIMPGYENISFGTFEQKYLDNCAICTAPSKTFNLAGAQVSNTFISNEQYRNKMTDARGYFSLNCFAYKACEFAYNRCEEWLDELITVLDDNRKFVEDFFAKELPEVKVHRLEGTYLMWLDFRAWGLYGKELEEFMQQKANFICDEGYIFGEGGDGFERLNIACPKSILKTALERLADAKRKYL